jgi:hypothetical protein
LSKILEKKKESLRLLQQKKKIPRSLCIKCELTTSPSYANNPVFLKLKTNLQQKVSIFVTEGARIMTKWTSMNVQLLTTDRCSLPTAAHYRPLLKHINQSPPDP